MKAAWLRRLAVVPIVVLATQAFAPAAMANHSWNGYHWARNTPSFTLRLNSSLSSSWQPYLSTTSTDWSKSAVVDTTIVAGSVVARRCLPTAGQVNVCDYKYGTTGWLGLGSVWVNGLHITQGTVKVNDTYFNQAGYNTPAWKNLVMCQETGHTLGLTHQDENFNNPNLNTCMDYTNLPESNQHPNQHDYDELATIYSHLDSFTTLRTRGVLVNPSANAANDDDALGTPVRRTADGLPVVFQRNEGSATKFTFVVWAR